jgi:hypothetical protein
MVQRNRLDHLVAHRTLGVVAGIVELVEDYRARNSVRGISIYRIMFHWRIVELTGLEQLELLDLLLRRQCHRRAVVEVDRIDLVVVVGRIDLVVGVDHIDLVVEVDRIDLVAVAAGRIGLVAVVVVVGRTDLAVAVDRIAVEVVVHTAAVVAAAVE